MGRFLSAARLCVSAASAFQRLFPTAPKAANPRSPSQSLGPRDAQRNYFRQSVVKGGRRRCKWGNRSKRTESSETPQGTCFSLICGTSQVDSRIAKPAQTAPSTQLIQIGDFALFGSLESVNGESLFEIASHNTYFSFPSLPLNSTSAAQTDLIFETATE